MTPIPRLLVALDSHHPQAWQIALAAANQICANAGSSVRNVVLLIHTKAQLNHTDLFGYIGTAPAKALGRGDAVNLSSGAKLRCETLKTLRYLSAKTVVIVYWADVSILDHVDGLTNLAGVIAVPEFPDDASQWEERWKPSVYGRPAKSAATTLISDPIVERALQTLTTLVNLSTGLGNPRDKQHAKNTLSILRAHNHQAGSEKIKSWAITHGWRPKDAVELALLAEKILGQRSKPNLSGIYNAQERYQQWREPPLERDH